MNNDNLLVFSIALGAIGLYSTFMPPVHEVVNGEQSNGEKQALREAEMIGTAHLLAVALIASFMAKSAMPLLLAAGLGVSVYLSYEYAMARVIG